MFPFGNTSLGAVVHKKLSHLLYKYNFVQAKGYLGNNLSIYYVAKKLVITSDNLRLEDEGWVLKNCLSLKICIKTGSDKIKPNYT